MNVLDAENCFKKGLVALVDNDPEKASTLFESAIKIEKQRGKKRPEMRYLSYFGLSVARSRGVTPDAVRACRTAAQRDFFNPDLQLNLGRVYLLAGRLSRALEAFQRGLRLAPRHAALRAEMARLDRRRAPVIRSLARNHPLNCWLGKLRHRAVGSGGRRMATSS